MMPRATDGEHDRGSGEKFSHRASMIRPLAARAISTGPSDDGCFEYMKAALFRSMIDKYIWMARCLNNNHHDKRRLKRRAIAFEKGEIGSRIPTTAFYLAWFYLAVSSWRNLVQYRPGRYRAIYRHASSYAAMREVLIMLTRHFRNAITARCACRFRQCSSRRLFLIFHFRQLKEMIYHFRCPENQLIYMILMKAYRLMRRWDDELFADGYRGHYARERWKCESSNDMIRECLAAWCRCHPSFICECNAAEVHHAQTIRCYRKEYYGSFEAFKKHRQNAFIEQTSLKYRWRNILWSARKFQRKYRRIDDIEVCRRRTVMSHIADAEMSSTRH